MLVHEQAPKQDVPTITRLIAGIEAGQSLSALFRQAQFHPFVPAIVRVGEETGDLADAFSRLGEHYQHRFEWRQKLIQSLIYPVIVAVLMLAVTIFVLYQILPRFESMYLDLGFALPPETQILFAVSARLRETFPSILLGVLSFSCLPFLLKKLAASRYPKASAVMFAIPGLKRVWRIWTSFRLADSIAVLTASGAPLLRALETCEQTAYFSWERKLIRQVKERILSGDTLTEALRAQRVDPMLVHAVRAAEASGDLAGVCRFAAKEFEGDLQRLLQRIVQLVEPMVIIGLGAFVCFLVLAVVLPMLQMVQSI